MSEVEMVHVVDDDEAMRDSLGFLLSTASIEVRTYESAAAFLATLNSYPRGCVITDVRMPEIGGLDLLRLLNEKNIGLPVIVITGHGDIPLAVEAMKHGAIEFLEKPFDDTVLLSAVKNALDYNRTAERRIADRSEIAGRIAELSQRERQVLDGLVEGLPNKSIAHKLGISPRTVEVYRSNVMTKMRAGSISELVRMVLTCEQK